MSEESPPSLTVSKVIGMINANLQQSLNKADAILLSLYEPTIQQIDQIRYNKFKQCLKRYTFDDQKKIPYCYNEVEPYEIDINFDQQGNTLYECINEVIPKAVKMAPEERDRVVTTQVEGCVHKYEAVIKGKFEEELKRISKLSPN